MSLKSRARTSYSWILQFMAGVVLVAGAFTALITLVLLPAARLDAQYAEVTVVVDYDRSPTELASMFPSDTDLPPRADLTRVDDRMLLSHPGAGAGLRLLSLTPVMLLGLVIALGCWSTFGLLRDIGEGDPFASANIRRLLAVAVLVLVGWLGFNLLTATAAGAVLADLGVTGGPLAPPPVFTVVPFAIAFVILAVAEAFRHGRSLQQDVSGLV